MGQELKNEDKYETTQDPTYWELSDVRNYLYIEYEGTQIGTNISTTISTNFYNNCYYYSNDHNDSEITFNYGNGINRTAIELPENFNPDDAEEFVDYLISIDRLDDAAVLMAKIVNAADFVSKRGKYF